MKRGQLNPGEKVRLVVENIKGLVWNPVAGKREFKVVVSHAKDPIERRLPKPITLNIVPGELSHLEALMPCTYINGSPTRIHITARDKLDNRVEISGMLVVEVSDKNHITWMKDGLTRLYPKMCGTKPVRAQALFEEVDLSCQSNVSVMTDDYQLFVGDLHCHDFLSEAEGYPDAVYQWAIEDRRLDFVSVVPQAHGWLDNETWTITKYMNERYLEEGKFVTFLGFEWQHTGYGDKVIHYLSGDQPYLPVDDIRYNTPQKLYEALRGSDALTVSHHSSYPPGSWCAHTDFESVETDVERLVELWSMHGSSEGYDPTDRPVPGADKRGYVTSALCKGLRLGFTAGSDTHSGRPGGSPKEPGKYWGGLTAVWAESLTRRSVFDALHARRTFALTGARIVLRMTVNGGWMGSELPPAEKADIRIDVWAPARIQCVQLMKNARVHRKFWPSADECHLEIEDDTHGPAFYYCRAIQEDGHLAVSSPVWVG